MYKRQDILLSIMYEGSCSPLRTPACCTILIVPCLAKWSVLAVKCPLLTLSQTLNVLWKPSLTRRNVQPDFSARKFPMLAHL
ncbi:hypothetical protein PO909_026049 [Leuciscus waleckii]